MKKVQILESQSELDEAKAATLRIKTMNGE